MQNPANGFKWTTERGFRKNERKIKMTNIKIIMIGLYLIGGLLLNTSAEAGIMYEEITKTTYTTPDQTSKTTTTRTRYVIGTDAMKIEAMDEGETTILRKDKKLIWTIYKDGTYTEMTFDEVRQMVASADQFSQEAMRDVGAITTQKTNETDMVQNLNCRKYQVFQGDELTTEVWMTTDLKFDKNSQELLDIMKSFAPPVFDPITQLEGMPVRTLNKVTNEEIDIESITEITTIQLEVTPSAEEFDLPANLKKIQLTE